MQGAHGASSSRNDLSGGSYKRKGKNKKKFTHGMASSKESEEVNETTLYLVSPQMVHSSRNLNNSVMIKLLL
ncbi:hypothetical protein V6N13_091990 [Hibiscus sabdariffa]|uniref:Uncharacterized protein n=1 Tax=Hibiscus sabdariffa TaxID=183260 RepID=A0ABR2QG30_9ROSI